MNKYSELWKTYRNDRTTDNRNRLVEAYRYIAECMSNSYTTKYYGYAEHDEILSYAYSGLIRAIETFKTERNKNFEAYAKFIIKKEIQELARSKDPLSRRYRDRKDRIDEIKQWYPNYTDEQIANKLGVSLQTYVEFTQTIAKIEGTRSIGSYATISANVDIEQNLIRNETKKQVRRILRVLNKTDRQVVKIVMDGVKPNMISKRIGLTTQQTQSQKKIVLDKLKNAIRLILQRNLKDYRMEKGWSQSELARRIGVNKSTIHRWEKDLQIPKPENFNKLVAIIKVVDKKELHDKYFNIYD